MVGDRGSSMWHRGCASCVDGGARGRVGASVAPARCRARPSSPPRAAAARRPARCSTSAS
eukprot:5812698-Prymnesium_polylepis.1